MQAKMMEYILNKNFLLLYTNKFTLGYCMQVMNLTRKQLLNQRIKINPSQLVLKVIEKVVTNKAEMEEVITKQITIVITATKILSNQL